MYHKVGNYNGYTDFMLYMFFPLEEAEIIAIADTEDWRKDDC